MKSFRKNVKAVSPVLSVLMMIAVAVAASLVTYAWVMGYLGFTTAKVGKAIQIQSIAYNGTSNYNLIIYVQNVGQGPVKLIDIYVNGIKQELKPVGKLSIAYTPGDLVLLEGKTATCMVETYFETHSLTDPVLVRAVTDDGTFTEASVTLS